MARLREGRGWRARFPLALLTLGLGAAGAEGVVVVLAVVFGVVGVTGTLFVVYGSLIGQIWAAVLSCFAILGGAIGARFGSTAEVVATGFAVLVLDVLMWAGLTLLFPRPDFFVGVVVLSGLIAAVGYSGLTYLYRHAARVRQTRTDTAVQLQSSEN